MKKPVLIIILLISGLTIASSQNKTSPREMFLEAESYFLYEEYNEALPLYVQLSVLYPKNDNLNYKLGRCYLYIPYEKEKAIGYLEKASKNINPRYKGDNLKETAAPPDVIFYLGDAYRINNKLEKAIAQYKQFKQTSDPAIIDHEMINDQINACENAIKLIKQPVAVNFTNIGETINSRFSENSAVISGDESTMAYSVQLQFYPAVFYSVKKNGVWSAPLNINPDLGVDEDCFPVGLSFDGKELLLYRNNEYLGDLYVSRLIEGKWSKIKKLNNNINTKYWESHASLSRDGKKLYFTSNRKGSLGGLDIYVSTRAESTRDDWGQATNLGPVVNSPMNEETPFITSDERKLYFSSLGHNGMGGYDIFVSEAGNNGWNKPQNIGYPINSTDHDLFFQPVKDGSEGYISLSAKDSYGRNDIYKVNISIAGSQLAAINKTLKEPEITTPSSEINKVLTKHNAKTEELNGYIAAVEQKENEVYAVTASQPAEPDTASLPEEPSVTENTPVRVINVQDTGNNDKLSGGQKQAWHKLLYGSIGILAVFVFFILLLYLRSRKRKNKQST